MSGYTKHEYELYMQETKSRLKKYLKDVIVALPREYHFEDVEKTIIKYYPFEWQIINERYQEYTKADIKLAKFGKKKRYNMPSPTDILESLPETQKLLSKVVQEEQSLYYGSDNWKSEYCAYIEEREKKINKRKEKIDKALKKAQKVEPEFLDRLIGLYDRKGTSQKDKVYIVLELKKYYCKKTINFFQRIAHAEINFQLRNEAVEHLLSLGHYAKLRKQKYMQTHAKNKKNRKRILYEYANEYFLIDKIPQELEYRIQNSKEQHIKTYDYFISHSYKDYDIVQQLIDELNRNGMNVYCDWISDSDYLKRNLVCDATLDVIEKRIVQSKAILFLSSENSQNSIWVKYELNFADENKKEIYYLDTQAFETGVYSIELLLEKWYLDAEYKKLKLISS